MTDYLQELADRLRKSKSKAPVSAPKQTYQQPVDNLGIMKSGPGGVVFNFGSWTGNPAVDNMNRLLSHHSDPVQAAIAGDQRRAFDARLSEHVRKGGGDGGQLPTEGVHGDWNKQLNKSLDQQVVEAIKSGEMTVDEGGGVQRQMIKGDFNRTTLKVGGETLTAQSPTDAAVLEMMKSMQDSDDPNEFVIDATEG